ncbi:MAG TPA: hypothetical protein K8W12_01930 [Tidjanibacter sp.]|jgi:hypothetical protein|nr:hypothetical protein [Tidjanibacter sp.]
MVFGDWKQKSKGLTVSPSLLWEYDMERFDWQRMRVVVMQRVIERGSDEDMYAALRLYGGFRKVREIVKEIPVLAPIDMNFVCLVFGLKKEELKCYTRRLSREKLLNS